MDTTSLILLVLFSLMVTANNPDTPNPNGDINATEQTTTSTDCGENCQLPSKPDDDEEED